MSCLTPVIPRTGRLGFVGDYTGSVLTRVARIRNWTMDEVANPELRTYSGLRYGTDRIPGFVEDTGTFQGFGGFPPYFVGDEFVFLGYTAPTSGIPCTDGCAFIVPAIVTSLNITWNFTQENRGVNWTIGFGSTGTLEEDPAFPDDCDDSVYCDPNPCDLEFEMFDCDDNEIDWCNIESISLNFTANIIPYSNNTTNCQVRKLPGNLDWTMEVVDQNTCYIPNTQEQYWFRIEADNDPSSVWELKYALSTGFSNFRIDTEAQAVIGKSNNFAMKAVNCCNPLQPERGAITDPEGRIVWPYSASS